MLPAQFFSDILRVPNGPEAGAPFKPLPWQTDCLNLIYGDSESPIVRECYISVAKKNAKSSLAAGILLYHLIAEPNERKAEIYSSAGSKEQAEIIFHLAASMVSYSPQLQELVESRRLEVFKDNMVYHAKDGDRIYRSLANEASNTHGIAPSVALIDEFHALRGRNGEELVDVLTKSQITRRNPLTIYLTHAGENLQSLAAEKEKLIDKYESGALKQPKKFVYRIYRPTDEHSWDSLETFRRGCPKFG